MLIELISFDIEDDYIELDLDNYNFKSKLKIYDFTGVKPNNQLWIVNGSLLDENTKINKTDNIRIILENNWIQISVKYNNKIYKLPSISQRFKIYNIKLIIYKLINLLPTNFNLIYNNKLLDDDEFIGKINITNESILNILPKINSGLK